MSVENESAAGKPQAGKNAAADSDAYGNQPPVTAASDVGPAPAAAATVALPMSAGRYDGWNKQAAHRSEVATVELSRFVRALTDLKTLCFTSPTERKRGLDIVMALEREAPAWGRTARFPAGGRYYVEIGQNPWRRCLMALRIALMTETAADLLADYYVAVSKTFGCLRDNENIVDRANAEKQLRLKWVE